MPTRNIVLTDHQDGLIASLLKSGRYQNASEILREGLRMVEQRDVEDQLRLRRLRAIVEQGRSDIANGDYQDFSTDGDLTAYLIAQSEPFLEAEA